MKVVNIDINRKNRIDIGRRGEGNVRKIVFDCTYFAETYGSGIAQLLHRRRGDEAPYPVLIEQDGNTVTWTVKESDTANVGIGEAELIWMLPDGNAKSAVYETETLRSLEEPGDPPEPWRAWVDDVIESADRAEAAEEQTKLLAQQVEVDKDTVDQAKALVMELGQKVADDKFGVEQSVSDFEVTRQNAVKEVKDAEQAAIENIGTGIDGSLTQSGKAADAKAAGLRIDSLKGDFEKIGFSVIDGMLNISYVMED